MKRSLLFGAGLASLLLGVAFIGGCNSDTGATATSSTTSTAATVGTFQLLWSEYPSWSVFGVAETAGLIDGAVGKMGTLEEKYGVDVEMKGIDYDGCLTGYASGTADAVCITNMDILSPSLGRNSVAILPTSTSFGADACIVNSDKISDLAALKGKPSYGLELSVSQYMFERALEKQGLDPKDFPFKQLDPQQAATALQNGQDEVESIVVWNPFVIQTKRILGDKAKVLLDSTEIPEEIVDMVVIGEDSLKKPGGDKFAQVIVDAYYAVSNMIEDPATSDETLITLGKKFGDLPLEDMKVIVQETKFYKTPDAGIGIFDRTDFQSEIMPKVVDFCASHGIVDTKPTIGYKAGGSEQLKFDTTFMQNAK